VHHCLLCTDFDNSYWTSLQVIDGFNGITSVTKLSFVNTPKLVRINGFNNLRSVTSLLRIQGSTSTPISLTSPPLNNITGFANLNAIESLYLVTCPLLAQLLPFHLWLHDQHYFNI
jgi:hypothetical protein